MGQSQHPEPRVFVLTGSERLAEIPYLTLCHSWALTGESLRLTTENIDEWQAGKMPLEGLAQTFRDAMRITQKLGYRYIWIDSLCIMQDSLDDWNREAHTMASVYENSLLAIFASEVTDADGLFPTRNPLEYYPYTISPPPDVEIWQRERPDSAGRSYHFESTRHEEHINNTLSRPVSRIPLLSRGWVVQERLLSPRIISLGSKGLLLGVSSPRRF